MCGGGEGPFQRAKPYLERMGRNIVHAGGPGNGQAAKICNNMILAISMIGNPGQDLDRPDREKGLPLRLGGPHRRGNDNRAVR